VFFKQIHHRSEQNMMIQKKGQMKPCLNNTRQMKHKFVSLRTQIDIFGRIKLSLRADIALREKD
jgi:hypothetical protein